jgi:hypothetical protein
MAADHERQETSGDSLPDGRISIDTAIIAGVMGDYAAGKIDVTVRLPCSDGECLGSAVLVALNALIGEVMAIRVKLGALYRHAESRRDACGTCPPTGERTDR